MSALDMIDRMDGNQRIKIPRSQFNQLMDNFKAREISALYSVAENGSNMNECNSVYHHHADEELKEAAEPAHKAPAFRERFIDNKGRLRIARDVLDKEMKVQAYKEKIQRLVSNAIRRSEHDCNEHTGEGQNGCRLERAARGSAASW
eukprot:CAMPEP_0197034974 /NCGR_PEP_ID=MMETSP1384-20130603/12887_1 /TAXON_ID=29189 /ORGANISM="Ammonia sp." /LENGTH=146 /DNA_ID=CAMNT_0042464955 /DNA_START=104 /DNA_END=541 /DNA_ORIENTATION=+